jgi:prolyl oligopeptidase
VKSIFLIVIFMLLNDSINVLSQLKIEYPETKKENQIDDYFGVKIPDPYRWLENTDSPEVKEWIEEENKVTFSYLEQIPYRNKIKERLTELWNYPKYSQPFKAGDYYFFYKNDGLQNQDVLYVQKDLNSEPEVFLDPNTFSNDGTVALNDIYDSRDGKYLAYSVSKSGSDWQEFFVMEIETKKKLNDHIKWSKFSSAAWFKDGFFYAKYDEPKNGNELTVKNEFQKVYYHKLGTEQSDDKLIYEDKTNPKRSHFVWTTEDEKYLFLYVGESGKEGNNLYFKRADDTKNVWTPIVEGFENIHWTIDNIDDKLLIMTNKDAPKSKVITVDLNNPKADWKTLIPEQEIVLNSVSYVGGKLITKYMKDATERVYVYDTQGKLQNEVLLPSLGSVWGFGGKRKETKVFYMFTSFTYPSTIYQYDIESNTSTLFRQSELKFNPEDYETKQVFYSSKDGTRIPMFIVFKKGLKLDGNNPTYLFGYGGFNINQTPYFSITRLVLLENGGIFAMPNIRGGGEYGEDWHKAGMMENKQNVFDDFIAAAEYLIKEGYTSPEKLAVAGGSNGGLLVGAVVNQRPDLFKVSLPAVGVMDMLRYQKFTIGSAWTREYGSSDIEEQFNFLIKYSPIHNINEGVNYPAAMVTTADHDDRVVPLHSYKYIATLQEKYKGPNPVLIRIDTKAGHGMGKPTDKIIEEWADTWAFMFYNMGLEIK